MPWCEFLWSLPLDPWICSLYCFAKFGNFSDIISSSTDSQLDLLWQHPRGDGSGASILVGGVEVEALHMVSTHITDGGVVERSVTTCQGWLSLLLTWPLLTLFWLWAGRGGEFWGVPLQSRKLEVLATHLSFIDMNRGGATGFCVVFV